jgi:hypothetical protein
MPEPFPSPRQVSHAVPRLERFDGMVDPRDVHYCDDQCICPIHKLQLFYSKQFRKHACQDTSCVHAHGMRNPDEYGFESVRIMRLQPDDVIVIQYKDPLSEDYYAKVAAKAKGVFPGHRVVILDSDTQISIARPDADLGSVKPNPHTIKDNDQ